MIQGLRTAIYHTADLERAREWYAGVLGFRPYFDEPFYVGFGVDGFELGLQPSEPDGALRGSGVVAYWEVGAAGHGDVQDVGGGIRVATVLDPDGDVFGVIENPHFSSGAP